MLKKLRHRFVRMSMFFIGILMVLLYIIMSAVLLVSITDGVRSTLEKYASADFHSTYYDIGRSDFDSAAPNVLDENGICVVLKKNDGSIEMPGIGRAYMAKKVLLNCISHTEKVSVEFGTISEYNVFFFKNITDEGTRIAFADSSRYYSYIGDMLKYGGITVAVILFALYLIIRKMAVFFLRPVERAWEQQQNFIGDASHELKTPLTVVLANCNILQTHRKDTVEEQMKWIESTNEEAAYMKDLVDKMLILAKNDADRHDRPLEEINFGEIATKLMLQFEPVAFEKGVELVSSIDESISINADPTAAAQILHILTDNAVKYAGMGGKACISLEKKHIRFRGDCAVLTANNTGDPIPEEDLPHIFERFYRSDKARTSGSGYGLGLAILKSICENNEASISVESNEKDGTTFTVVFRPLKRRKPKKKD